jgi:hypothetical protein
VDALSKLAGSAFLTSADETQLRFGYLPVECGVITCDQLFSTVTELRAHAKRNHDAPAHSVHRSSPATQYVQDLIWPPGVVRTVANGLRRLAELEWIDKDREEEVQEFLANGTRGHHQIPLDRIAPHSDHLSGFHDGHSEVLVTIGLAHSPPHIDFYSADGSPPAGFRPISGNQLLLAGTKQWTHIPSDFLDRGFEWMRNQMQLGSAVSRTWPHAIIHAGDETTAGGGEIHAVTQLSDITLSLGSAFYELDNTTIPQDRQWLKESRAGHQ